jgi:hypothetical protein
MATLDSMSEHSEHEAVPAQLRLAAGVVCVQAAGLFAAAVVLVVKTIAGHPDSVGRALFGAAMALLGMLVLLTCVRGILALRWAARTPIVVIELLALPVSYSLGFQADRMVYGAPILISALAVLYLMFTPPVRAALDHELQK